MSDPQQVHQLEDEIKRLQDLHLERTKSTHKALTQRDDEIKRLSSEGAELFDALRITLSYGLGPHDVSGTAQWKKAREIYQRVSGNKKVTRSP